MSPWMITANVLGWPLIHLAVARITLRMPLARFATSAPSSAAPRCRELRFYRDVLRVQRWKSRLPDGAPWLGGFSKKRFAKRDREYVMTFVLETRRAEFAHWCMLSCLPVFFFWNPPWACAVMTGYAVAANLPCIVAQRHNRIVLSRLLEKLECKARASAPTLA